MENIGTIIITIICWFTIGWLSMLIKVWYWNNFLIKKGLAEKYFIFNFREIPFGVYYPICLLWPSQSIHWLLSDLWEDEESTKKSQMPIIPLSYDCFTKEARLKRSSINNRFYKNEKIRLDLSDKEVNRNQYIKHVFGFGIMLGGFHIIFWILGIFVWILAIFVWIIIIIILLFIIPLLEKLAKFLSYLTPKFK